MFRVYYNSMFVFYIFVVSRDSVFILENSGAALRRRAYVKD